MALELTPSTSTDLLRTLAEFRVELRQFLLFSEEAAVRTGLAPQQHQLLLQVAGAPAGELVTVAYVAGKLGLRHHSVVELCDRCEEAGLLKRSVNPQNRRQVLLRVTRAGDRALHRLSEDHVRELDELGPRLIAALKRVRSLRAGPPKRAKAAAAQ